MAMTVLEMIGTGVGIVAAVLGGVWFIINKAFGVGRFSHRIEEVDKRTSGAACESHSRDIDSIKGNIQTIKTDVATIKSLLVMKHKEAASVFSMKNSPRQLNETGKQLLTDIKGLEFLEKYKSDLFAQIDGFASKTALDVENAAHGACMAYVDQDMFNDFKNFVYNTPSYMVRDASGQESRYDLTIPDICFVLSLPLRDMYLEAHPQIMA